MRSHTAITRSMWCSTSRTDVCCSEVPHKRGELVHLVRRQTGGRLVEQQQLGLRDKGAGERDALLHAVRQLAGQQARHVRDLEPLQRRDGALLAGGARRGRRAAVPSKPEPNHARECRSAPTSTFSSTVRWGNRPRPCSVRAIPRSASWCGRCRRSGLPRQLQLALGRANETADHVEQRGLAGAVGPDDPDDLALVDRRGDLGERSEPAEADADVVDVEQHSRHLAHPSGRGR